MSKKWMWILIILGTIGLLVAGIGAYKYYKAYQRESTLDKRVRKPAIYLYPVEDSQIFVRVNINGKMTADIPEYRGGWNVFATKEGVIDNRYDYLFYENTLNRLELPEEGWVVAQEDLYNWFDTNLPKLGLNKKEIIQFKEYWLYELKDSKYYEIKPLDKKFLDENMDLIITPKPDSEIRVLFYFKGIDSPKEIEKPTIETPERKGFAVVEWGGIVG